MSDTKVESPIKTKTTTEGDGEITPERKPRRSPKADVLNAAAVEKEFQAFISKLQSKYPSNLLAYQVSNFSEGLELSVRVAKKTGETGADFTSTFSNRPNQNQRNRKNEKPLTEEQKEERRKKNEIKRAKEFERRRQRGLKREQEKENINGTEKSGDEKAESKEEGLKEEKKAEPEKNETALTEKAAA